MNNTRILDLQARQLEGDSLTFDELFELSEARRSTESGQRELLEDLQMHEDLKQLFQLERSGESFASQCLVKARLHPSEPMTSAPITSEPMTSAPSIVAIRPKTPSPLRTSAGRDAWQPGWIAVAASTVVLIGVIAFAILKDKPEFDSAALAAPGQSDPLTESRRLDDVVREVGDSFPDVGTENPDATPTAPERQRWDGLHVSVDGQWEIPPPTDPGFPARYQLHQGSAELVLKDGTQLTFMGPVDFTVSSPREVSIATGQMRVQPVADGTPFSLNTPSVQLNANEAFTSYLNVRPDMGTYIQMEEGALRARPWNSASDHELTLAAVGLDRGLISPEWHERSSEPATAMAMNEKGAFEGVIAATGQPLRVSSPELFERVLEASRTLIEEDQNGFPSQWQAMIANLEQAESGMQMNINGTPQSFDSPAAMLQQFERIREQLSTQAFQGNSAGFSGVINVNGREQRFSSPEEFAAAQENMFGSLFSRVMNPAPLQSDPVQTDANENPDVSRFSPPPGSSLLPLPNGFDMSSSSSFSGMISNGSRTQQFSNKEDFERALQQLGNRK